MNYLEIVQRLKQETGIAGPLPTSVASTVGDTRRLTNWVKDAWLDIQKSPYRWKWRRETVSGEINTTNGMAYTVDQLLQQAPGTEAFHEWRPASSEYTVRAGRQDNTGLWDLTYLDRDVWNGRFLNVISYGAPQFWSVSNLDELLIGPSPDMDYDVRAEYLTGYQELANDADLPLMPSEHHMLIVWEALTQYGGFDAAPEVVARAERNRERMYSDLIRTQAEMPRLKHKSL